jgi:Fe-S-cluster containining protein
MECLQCGICCKLFVINLNKEEYNSKQYKTIFEDFGHVQDFEEAELIGANLLAQKEDGKTCIYLENKKCSIHHRRPKCCQAFFCDSDQEWSQSMIKKINLYKQNHI